MIPPEPHPFPGGAWWRVDRSAAILWDDAPPTADDDQPAPDEPAIEARWRELCAQNPRLFNGPVAAFGSFDGSTLRAHRSDYRRFAVQPEIDTGVRVLAVSGLLIARDSAGEPCVLIARRGPRVHAHPGLWETAPSGTVPPPRPGGSLSITSLADHLAVECREELGFAIDPARAEPVLMVRDDLARSVDVLFRVDLPEPIEPAPPDAHAWEYDDWHWVTPADLARFDGDRADACIPPVRAIVRAGALGVGESA